MFVAEQEKQLRSLIVDLQTQLSSAREANVYLREQWGDSFQRQQEMNSVMQAVSLQSMRMVEELSLQLDSARYALMMLASMAPFMILFSGCSMIKCVTQLLHRLLHPPAPFSKAQLLTLPRIWRISSNWFADEIS